MVLLSLPQRKGGVGKTTLVRILADYFGARKRVLLVDLDDQCNLSSIFLPMEYVDRGRHLRPPLHPDFDPALPDMADWSGRSSVADIFFPNRVIYQYEIARLGEGRVDILPADSRQLIGVREKEKEREKSGHQTLVEEVIGGFFQSPELAEEYDLVIFDSGPSENSLMRGVIKASSHVIIPTIMEQQCVDGLTSMCGMITEEQERRPSSHPLTVVGVQVNMFRKGTSLHAGFLENVRNMPVVGDLLNPVLLPHRVAYAERDVKGVLPRSIFDLKPSDTARQKALEFCQFVEAGVFGDGHAS
ncbi:MAG: ParA family protein [Salinisphaeraceae bacterium]